MCQNFCVFDKETKIPPTGRGKLNLEVLQILICMPKVRKLAEIAPNIGFSEFDYLTFASRRLIRVNWAG